MDYEITAEEVKAKLDAGESFTLIDVREPWEFETARIEGAKLIPMGDVPSRAHQELDPEDHIVVLCHRGVRSMNVTAWLRQQPRAWPELVETFVALVGGTPPGARGLRTGRTASRSRTPNEVPELR